MSKQITIDREYPGYTLLGWAQGKVEVENRQTGEKELRGYFQIFVTHPVSAYSSDTYQAVGLKCEKKACMGPIWEEGNFNIGDRVKLFFDDRQKVIMMALDD